MSDSDQSGFIKRTFVHQNDASKDGAHDDLKANTASVSGEVELQSGATIGSVQVDVDGGGKITGLSVGTIDGETVEYQQLSAAESTLAEADASLTARLSSDEDARTSSDRSLVSRLSDGEGARESSDGSLESRLSDGEGSRLESDGSLGSGILSEESARGLADASLSSSVSAGAAERSASDVELEGLVRTSAGALTAADSSLSSRVDAETDARLSAAASLSSALSAGLSDLASADASLAARIEYITSNIDDKALDSLTEIVSAFQSIDAQVDAEISSYHALHEEDFESLLARITLLVSAEVSLNTEISAEESTRAAADASLSVLVSLEEEARALADASISTLLSSETSTRESADAFLEPILHSESSRATSAEESLALQISSEVASLSVALSSEALQQVSADESLSAAISSVISVSSSASESIEGLLSSEETARVAADSSLEIRLSSEETAASSAVSSLSSRLSSEVLSQTSADGSLSSRLSSEVLSQTSADGSLSSRLSSEAFIQMSADESLALRVTEIEPVHLTAATSAEGSAAIVLGLNEKLASLGAGSCIWYIDIAVVAADVNRNGAVEDLRLTGRYDGSSVTVDHVDIISQKTVGEVKEGELTVTVFSDGSMVVSQENSPSAENFYWSATRFVFSYNESSSVLPPASSEYSLSVSSATPGTSTLTENTVFTFTFTSTGPDGTFYWTNAGLTDESDFVEGINSGSFEVVGGTGIVTLTTRQDQLTEGTETIVFQVREGSTTGNILASTRPLAINDTSIGAYSIAVNRTSAEENEDQPQPIVFTISTTSPVSTLYWTMGGTTEASDFLEDVDSGTLSVQSGVASLTLTPRADRHTEGNETMVLQVRENGLDGDIVATRTVTILDSSKTVYIVSSSASQVYEGSSVTFTFSTSDVRTTQQYRWNLEPVSGWPMPTLADFTGLSSFSNQFSIDQGSDGTYTTTLNVKNDAVEGIYEPDERFRFVVSSSDGGSNYTYRVQSDPVTITDLYTVTTSSASLNETTNRSITFTFSTAQPDPSAVYYWDLDSSVASSVSFADLENSESLAGIEGRTFTAPAGSHGIPLTLRTDQLDEGPENIRISIYAGTAPGTLIAKSPTVAISDTSLTDRQVSASVPEVYEGSSVTFTYTTTDPGEDGQQLVWDLVSVAGVVDYEDFEQVGGANISDEPNRRFTTTGGAYSITLNVKNDIFTEGNEQFMLRVSKSDRTAIRATSPVVTVRDYYSLIPTLVGSTTQVSSINEGQTARFTFRTQGLDGEFFWGLSADVSSIGFEDFVDGAALESIESRIFTTAGGSHEIDLALRSDLMTEGLERFTIAVYASTEDPALPTLIVKSPTVTVQDTSQTVYGITPSSPQSVFEGSPITFKFTTTDTRPGQVFNWQIIRHNDTNSSPEVSSADFEVPLLGANFSPAEYTIEDGIGVYTKQLTPKNDFSIENSERFRLRVREGSFGTGGTIRGTSGIITVSDLYRLTQDRNSVNETTSPNIRFTFQAFGPREDSLYWELDDTTTATYSDFTGDLANIANRTFTTDPSVNSGIKYIDLTVAPDSLTEGPETFRILVFSGSSPGGTLIARSGQVTIDDTSLTNRQVSASTSTVYEGSSITFTYTTTDSGEDGQSLTWDLVNSSDEVISDFSDFEWGGDGEVDISDPANRVFTTTGGTHAVTLNVLNDSLIDSDVQYKFRVSTSGGTPRATSPLVTVKDYYTLVPTLVASESQITSIDEGQTARFAFRTQGPDEEFFWALNSSLSDSVSFADFSSTSALESVENRTFTTAGGSFDILLTLAEDLLTEGAESLQVQVYSGSQDPVLVASSLITVGDTSLTLRQVAASVSEVYEGSSITFTYTTSDAGEDAQSLAWDLIGVDGQPVSDFSDFVWAEGVDISEVANRTFNTTGGAYSIVLNVKNDALAEPDNEQFRLRVSTTDETPVLLATSPVVKVSDYYTLVPTLISSEDQISSIDEGQTARFVFRTQGPDEEFFWALNSSLSDSVSFADFSSDSALESVENRTFTTAGGSFDILLTLAEDLLTEGAESLQVQVYSGSQDPVLVASSLITVGDTSPTEYLISASKAEVYEGSSVTFTYTTSDPGEDGQQLVWSLVSVAGTVDYEDFVWAEGIDISDAANRTFTTTGGAHEITLSVKDDVFTEVNDQFSLRVSTSGGTVRATSPVVTISDLYTLIPTLVGSDDPITSVDEGQTVRFTFRTQGSDGEFFWKIDGAEDFSTTPDFSLASALSDMTGDVTGAFTTSEKSASFDLVVRADLLTEGDEYLRVSVYSDSEYENIVIKSPLLLVNDTSETRYDLEAYAGLSGDTPVNTIDEGDIVRFEFTTTGPTGQFYWDLSFDAALSPVANEEDFAGIGQLTSNIFDVNSSGTGSFSFEINADRLTEALTPESFVVSIRNLSSEDEVLISKVVSIQDTSQTDYELIPTLISVEEGSSTTFNFTTTGQTGTFYWEISSENSDISISDFEVPSQLTSNAFTVGSAGAGSFEVRLRSDQLTEGPESFVIKVRRDSDAGEVVASSEVTVGDTSRNSYTLVPSTTSVNEGLPVSFTFTTTGLDDSFSWRIEGVEGSTAPVALDFEENTLAGTLSTQGKTGQVTLNIKNGIIAGDAEKQFVLIVSTPDFGDVQSDPVTVNSFYKISSPASPLDEGQTATFTFTTSDPAEANTTFYWENAGTTSDSDFQVGTVAQGRGSFTTAAGTATVSLGLREDLLTEGQETIRINIYSSDGYESGNLIARSAIVSVNDSSVTQYAITALQSSVEEDGSVQFTFTTTGPDGTFYWRNIGSALGDDFTDGKNDGEFSTEGGSYTLELSLDGDYITEGTETIQLVVAKSVITDINTVPILASSELVSVIDTTNESTHRILSSLSADEPLYEGSSATFTFYTEEADPDTREYYWRVVGGVSDSDFEPVVDNIINVDATGTGSFTLAARNNFITETDRAGRIEVVRSPSDTRPLTRTGNIALRDRYTYSISRTSIGGSLTTGSPDINTIDESTSIRITLTMRSPEDINAPGVYYWQNVGTAAATDFEGNLNNGTFQVAGGVGTIDIAMKQDLLTEGSETVRVKVTSGSFTSSNVIAEIPIDVNDTSLTTYTVTPSTNTVYEGSPITFTFSTTDTRTAQDFRWNLERVPGLPMPTAADFTGLSSVTNNQFSIAQGSDGTYTTTLNVKNDAVDGIYEPDERFRFVVSSSDGTYRAQTGGITIKDLYTITTSSATVNINETTNPSVEFTFYANQPGHDPSTEYYWDLDGTVANAVSFADLANSTTLASVENRTFTAPAGSSTISFSLRPDLVTEGTENIRVSVYSGSAPGTLIARSPIVTVTDTSKDIYAISSSADQVSEGSTVTFTFTTTGYDNTFYWENYGTTNADDFTQAVNSDSFSTLNGTGSIALTLKDDFSTEGTESDQETIRVRVRSGSPTGTQIATSSIVHVVDTSQTAYDVTADKTSVFEGSSIEFTFTTSDPAEVNTTFYWTNGGTTTASDFDPSVNSGEFTTDENGTGTVRLTLRGDDQTEGTGNPPMGDTIIFQVRRDSLTGPILATSFRIRVTDVLYSIVPDVTEVNEGQTVTFTFTGPAGQYFWQNVGTAVGVTNADGAFVPDTVDGFGNTAASGSFTTDLNGSGTVTLTARLDKLTEGTDPETIILNVRGESHTGILLATSPTVTVSDTSQTEYSLTATPASVDEGSPVAFTFTSTGLDERFYWDIAGATGNITSADFPTGEFSGFFDFARSAGLYSFFITPRADKLTEGAESFTLNIRRGSASGDIVASATVGIVDTSGTEYKLAPSIASINEGSSATFDFTTTGPTGPFYWEISSENSNLSDLDFTAPTQLTSNIFTVNSAGTGSFLVSVSSDQLTEGAESFIIKVRSGSGAGEVVASSEVTINDTSLNFYTLVPSITTAYSGSTVEFTFTTTGPGGTFYWVDEGDLLDGDFSPASKSGQFNVEPESGVGTKTGTFSRTVATAVDGSMVIKIYSVNPSSPGAQALQNGSTDLSSTVTVKPDVESLVLLIQTDITASDGGYTSASPDNAFTLYALGRYTVNWGDGTPDVPYGQTTEITTSTVPTKVYATEGEYVIRVRWESGSSTRRHAPPNSTTTDAIKIKELQQWGTTQWTSCADMFRNCRNLIGTYTDTPVLTRSGLSASNMFRDCALFNGSPAPGASMNGWNTATITNMSEMFRGATAFNQPIGSWNTAAVTTMFAMFSSATAFNRPLNTDGNSWRVSSVTNMQQMFNNADSFNQSLGTWTLNSSVTFSNMLDTSSPTLGMDPENYSRTLIGWSNAASPPSTRSLGALNRRRTNVVYPGSPRNTGIDAHTHLTRLTTASPNPGRGWTITGDAQITYNLYAPASIDEGTAATYTLGITGSASSDPFRLSTFFWENSGTTSALDFTEGGNNGSLAATSTGATTGEAQLTRTLASDLRTEGAETIVIQFRTGSLEGTVLQSATTTVNDTSNQSSLLVSALVDGVLAPVTSVEEGTVLTYSFTTDSDDSTFYWTLGGSAEASVELDLAQGAQGSFPVTALAGQPGMYGGQFSVEVLADQVTEGSETLVMSVRKGGIEGSAVASVPVTIVDTSLTQYTLTAPSELDEGAPVTFTFTTTGPNGGPGDAGFFWSLVPDTDGE